MKNKTAIQKIILIVLMASLVFFPVQVFAQDIVLTEAEYSEEYQKWLQLSDEEKESTLQPRMFDIEDDETFEDKLKNTSNKLKVATLLKSSSSDEYDLRDYISNNITVKDQMSTNGCWAFASLGVLESNLAMQNYLNGTTNKTYDFSERHMMYSICRSMFLNNKVNDMGYNTTVESGGNAYMASSYLTNGSGAVDESSMPFVDSQDSIDISLIQNKEVTATVLDTKEFETYSASQKDEIMPEMKSYIQTYGGLYAGIYVDMSNLFNSSYYNNGTGAIYVNNESKAANHAIEIIGWDDNYSKSNFKSGCQPKNDGAWIIKNSWGESYDYSLSATKQSFYDSYESTCKSNGWNSASEIPDSVILEACESIYGENKVTINSSEDKITIILGNNGYMYVSYEDVNIYKTLWGITKSTEETNYDNLYQHDTLYPIYAFETPSAANMKIASVYDKVSTTNKEQITAVSIHVPENYDSCKVYVNPKSSDLSDSNLQEVSLSVGDTIDLESGYNTIEFESPITITGDQFAVVLEVGNTTGHCISLVKEVTTNSFDATKDWSAYIDSVSIDEKDSYISVTGYDWMDLSEACVLENSTAITDSEISWETNTTTWKTTATLKAYTKNVTDTTGPKCEVTQKTSNDKKSITVTITANETIVAPDGWMQVNDTTITRTYTENGTYTVEVSDEFENTSPVKFTIDTIETTSNNSGDDSNNGTGDNNNSGGDSNNGTGDNNNSGGDSNNGTGDNNNSGGDSNNGTGDNNNSGGDSNNGTGDNNNSGGDSNNGTGDNNNKATPVNSDFTNAKSSLTKLSYDGTSTGMNVTITISGIKIGDETNTYSYEYYLSGSKTQPDKDDSNWCKIDAKNVVKESNGTYTITISLDTSTLSNNAEVLTSDNLYIHIKETASIDNQSSVKISTLQVTASEKVEQNTEKEIEKTTTTTTTTKSGDTTVANTILPYTGRIGIIVTIIAIMVVGGFSFYRYKNIDR